MNRKLIVRLATFAFMAAIGSAIASDESNFSVIDEIIHVFPSGGGTYDGSNADGPDDSYIVFAANAADSLDILITIPDGNYKNAILLEDVTDGKFQVGDAINVTNFNVDQVGQGDDLEILAHIGDLEFDIDGSLIMNAPYTGEYLIAVGNANDDIVWCCDFSVQLSGNTRNVREPLVPSEPVPTLSTYALWLLILGFTFLTLKQLRRPEKS